MQKKSKHLKRNKTTFCKDLVFAACFASNEFWCRLSRVLRKHGGFYKAFCCKKEMRSYDDLFRIIKNKGYKDRLSPVSGLH